MTEEEWLVNADLSDLLRPVILVWGNRKLRLLYVACCGQVWDLLDDEKSRRVVVAAEELADTHWLTADTPAFRIRLRTIRDEAREVASTLFRQARDATDARTRAWAEARAYAASAAEMTSLPSLSVGGLGGLVGSLSIAAKRWAQTRGLPPRVMAKKERAVQRGLLRDIFGNPFRPVTRDWAWLTSDVVALARGIYDDRAFDRMPILADALQDAGCDNDDVLDHCRDENATHVRGCWVVDLLLGKS